MLRKTESSQAFLPSNQAEVQLASGAGCSCKQRPIKLINN